MNDVKTIPTYKDMVNCFIEQGCSMEEAIKFIKYCPELFNMSIEEIDKKVHFLYNSNALYGIIICNQNDIKEYIYSNLENPNHELGYSYVTQSFINIINHQDFIQKALGIQPTDTLEDKLYKLKKATFNSSGYKIR